MLNWVNFLHLYQPPGQREAVLKAVTKESYALIVRLLKQYPSLKITMNIAGSLLEQLERHGNKELFDDIRILVEAGRIELTASAMYHPILPMLPEAEVRRQISLHDDISRRIFGTAYNPSGFFMPEMAYSAEVGKIISDLGFTWTILDQAHLGHTPDPETKYIIPETKLAAIFRNRTYSKTFPPESIIKNLSSIQENYIVTAHDGELYGHWHKNDGGYYEKAFTHSGIQFLTVSEYISELSDEQSVVPKKTNWEATPEEEKQDIQFGLWNHPSNKIHALLWEFAYFCIPVVEKCMDDPQYAEARSRLDRGLSSCSWWWASGVRPDGFSIIAWDPSVIERGATELVRSIRALHTVDSKKKIAAEKLYAKIVLTAWSQHWERQV